MNLTDLVTLAAKSPTRASKTPLHALSIVSARAAVKINDGNKKKSETSQGLKLSFGRRSVSLDAISAGAVKFDVPTVQVPAATVLLQAAIDDGTLDAAIIAVQKQMTDALAAPKVVAETPVSVLDTTSVPVLKCAPNVDGLDLDAI